MEKVPPLSELILPGKEKEFQVDKQSNFRQ